MNAESKEENGMEQEWKRGVEKKLNDIHMAVVGNKELGTPGLVKRIEDLEKFKQEVVLKIAMVTGAVTGVGLFLQYVLK